MVSTIILSFVAGVMGANAIPHFVMGITKQSYPMIFGNSPLPNFIVGWVGLVIAALLGYWAHVGQHPVTAFLFFALGVLLMGLFHAGPGAFGKKS